MKTIFVRDSQIGPEASSNSYTMPRHTYTLDLGDNSVVNHGQFPPTADTVLEVLSSFNRSGDGVFPLSGFRRREGTSTIVIQCAYHAKSDHVQHELWIILSSEEMTRDTMMVMLGLEPVKED